jgi:hypothetical protein
MRLAPFVFYCHPYEFDIRELKELPLSLPLHIRIHQVLGRRWFERRFLSFAKRFGGRTMRDLLSSQRWPELDLHTFRLTSSALLAPQIEICRT